MVFAATWAAFAALPSSADAQVRRGSPLTAKCAEDSTLPECQVYRVEAIVFQGLLRTKRRVVDREVIFEEGDTVTLAEVEESIQRLRNTGLFRIVKFELLDHRVAFYDSEDKDPNQEVFGTDHDLRESSRILKITVDERWTLLPMFRFSRGGDVFQFSVGLQDANLFGSYLQLGGQYDRLGEADSFAVWFRNPRLFDHRLAIAVDVALSNRGFTLYDSAADIEGGFLLSRKYVSVSLDREWLWWWRTGIQVALFDDEYSYTLISDAVRDAQEQSGGLPQDGATTSLSASSRWGRLNSDNYRIDGVQFQLRLSQNIPVGGESFSVTRLQADFVYFQTLPLKSTIGLRLGTGTSNAEPDQHLYYAGGLDTVRGYLNMQFRGAHYWLSNLEYRIPSLDTRWLTLQHVFFGDMVGVSRSLEDLSTIDGISTGIGLRIISPKIYGLVVRLDYAFGLLGQAGPSFSFGAQQFF